MNPDLDLSLDGLLAETNADLVGKLVNSPS